MVTAERAAFSEHDQSSAAFLAPSHDAGAGLEAVIFRGDPVDIGLQRVDAFDPEADMIHPAGGDARSLKVETAPGDDHQRDAPIGQVKVFLRRGPLKQ